MFRSRRRDARRVIGIHLNLINLKVDRLPNKILVETPRVELQINLNCKEESNKLDPPFSFIFRYFPFLPIILHLDEGPVKKPKIMNEQYVESTYLAQDVFHRFHGVLVLLLVVRVDLNVQRHTTAVLHAVLDDQKDGLQTVSLKGKIDGGITLNDV